MPTPTTSSTSTHRPQIVTHHSKPKTHKIHNNKEFTPSFSIEEVDEANHVTARYVDRGGRADRGFSDGDEGMDVVDIQGRGADKMERIDVTTTRERRVEEYYKVLVDAFLPVGFPDSVTGDYLEYQIYDSLQAFSSSIAGMLSSRAVLEGIGVGSTHTTPTAALLLSILQSSLGRLATIAFASRMSSSLEPECKAYRFLADIFNDLAIILDCVSPALPAVGRVSALCGASVLRALCGVAAGSAKASLSAHFAKRGNVGELSAKDSSQETVISLMGMLAGSLLVPYITSTLTTWICLLILLTIHLYTNYRAVKAVCLPSLNCQRACLVFSHYLSTKNQVDYIIKRGSSHVNNHKFLTPKQVSEREQIFAQPSALRCNGTIVGYCLIGVPLMQLLNAQKPSDLSSLITTYSDLPYLLTFNKQTKTVYIALKKHDQRVYLQAWFHALMVVMVWDIIKKDGDDGLDESLERIVRVVSEEWMGVEEGLVGVGWNVDEAAVLTVGRGRVRIGGDGDSEGGEEKKEL